MRCCRLSRSPQARNMTLAMRQRCLPPAGTAAAGAVLCVHRWAATLPEHVLRLQGSLGLFCKQLWPERYAAVCLSCHTPRPQDTVPLLAIAGIHHRNDMQARRTGSTSSGGKQPSAYGQQALAAALSWQHTSLSNKNAEGSATSDEDHPRCAAQLLSP